MELDLQEIENLRIDTAQDIYEIIHKVFFERHQKYDLHKEHFWTFSLNNAFKILNLELISIGSNSRTIAEPAEIFRIPMYKSSTSIVLVHNHPSGDLIPSEADLGLTNRLIKVGMLLNIEVLDHVIVSPNTFYSFRANSLIEKLKYDKKYAYTFLFEKEINKKITLLKKEVEKEKKEIAAQNFQKGEEKGIKKGIKARNLEIARKMLKKKIEGKEILEITGITKQWLGRLEKEKTLGG